MAQLPVWAVGRHVTAFTLVPQSQDTSGNLTDVTASQSVLYGHMNSCEVESRRDNENISAMDRQFGNMVKIEDSTFYRCEELEVYSGANMLAYQGYNFGAFKIILTRGAQSWTGYAALGFYRMSATKRSVRGSMELVPLDIGGTLANPVYG